MYFDGVSLVGPPPISTNPFLRVANDLRAELRAPASYPRGDALPSVRRTHRVITDPLGLLLDAYERYGPVFSMRVLTTRVVFMLGPAANHRILVSHASDFTWRDGGFADLIPLLGDGLLTIDGDFHNRSRRIMLPAFHRDRIAAALGTMESEIERAVEPWRPGDRFDLYLWARELALRVAMRALFGLDPDRRPAGLDPAREFERALGYYGRDYWLQIMRGPRTPWAALSDARRRLDGLVFGEIERRRRSGERGEDLLSLLLDATGEDGERLSDAHVRDEVMTLLFAGHDTTTATVAFLFRELALRPDVWEAPHEFRPERWEHRAALPKGAYVPFGGGSRQCIGMRFGQLEIKAIAARVLREHRLELEPGHRLEIRQTPTLGPKGGLPMRVRRA